MWQAQKAREKVQLETARTRVKLMVLQWRKQEEAVKGCLVTECNPPIYFRPAKCVPAVPFST